MPHPFQKPLAAAFLLLPLLANSASAAGIGWDPGTRISEPKPFFEILAPWDSARAFALEGGIPEVYRDAQAEFLDEMNLVIGAAENFWAYYKKLTGNNCERMKVEKLEQRRREALATQRDMTVGWLKETIVGEGGALILEAERRKFSPEALHRLSARAFLLGFLQQTKARVSGGSDFSLLGAGGSANCAGVECGAGGELCIGDDQIYDDTEINKLANLAQKELQDFLCTAERGGFPTASQLIDDPGPAPAGKELALWEKVEVRAGSEASWKRIEELRRLAQKFLKTWSKFLLRAQGLQSVQLLDMSYDFNTGATIAYWQKCPKDCEEAAKKAMKEGASTAEAEKMKKKCQANCPPPLASCLARSETAKFLRVNFSADSCGCPSFQTGWLDLTGAFQQLFSQLSGIGNLKKNLVQLWDLIWFQNGAWSKLGKQMVAFNNDAIEDAAAEFKKKFGYPPASGNYWDRAKNFFKRLLPWNAVRIKTATGSEIVLPGKSEIEILREKTANGGTVSVAELAAARAAEVKRVREQKERAKKGATVLELIKAAQEIRWIGFDLKMAAQALQPASCAGSRKAAAYDAAMEGILEQESTLVDSYDWQGNETLQPLMGSWTSAGIEGMLKGASAFDNGARAVFSALGANLGGDGDVCRSLTAVRQKMNLH